MARISIYEQWEKDGELQDKLILIKGMARDGLTQQQIANNLGISIDTLIENKKKFPLFYEAIKKGKEIVDFEVENALLKSAMEGNVTAQIFWLKNRKQKQWREKVDVENDIKVNNGVITDLIEALKDEKENRRNVESETN